MNFPHASSRFFLLSAAAAFLVPQLLPAAISVGSSSLIQQLDYSDSFSFGPGAGGTRNGQPYNAQDFPLPAGAPLAVENSYGNPARAWTGDRWSLANDIFVNSSVPVYPGTSGGGSSTGFTQTGGAGVDYGIEYDVRNDFVVQFDAVQVDDRVNISATQTRDGFGGANALSVFFRADGYSNLGNTAEVGIYNAMIGECLTTFDTGAAGLDAGEWHNYAVRFDLVTFTLSIYVDEMLLGDIDLATFGGPLWGGGSVAPGAFLGVLDGGTNDAVSVGAAGLPGSDRLWTDNFQVGAPVPEPGGIALTSLAALALLGRRGRVS